MFVILALLASAYAIQSVETPPKPQVPSGTYKGDITVHGYHLIDKLVFHDQTKTLDYTLRVEHHHHAECDGQHYTYSPTSGKVTFTTVQTVYHCIGEGGINLHGSKIKELKYDPTKNELTFIWDFKGRDLVITMEHQGAHEDSESEESEDLDCAHLSETSRRLVVGC